MHNARGRPAFALAVALLLATAARHGAAQDTQYWSDGYGTQARLLGGIMIGSDEDLSAVYYNPGGIGLADSLQILISLNALRYTSLSYSVPSVPNPPSSGGWSAISNMFGGTIPIGGRDSKARLAYSLLTRQYFNFGAQLRALPLDSFSPVPAPPGTTGVGNLAVNQQLAESWGGVTYARAPDRHWGYGASLFIAIRSQTFSNVSDAQVVSGNGKTALGLREYDFSYYNWAALLKFGVEYKAEKWAAGLTLTTPRLDLFGGASTGVTRSYVDQGVVGGAGSSQILTSYQMNLGSTYHSPLSVGAGWTYSWKTSKLSLAAEWFNAVPEYTLIAAQPAVAQSGSDTLDMALTSVSRALINWGVGFEHSFNEHWQLYAAYRTDLTSVPNGVQPLGTLVNYDLYHGNLGVQATVGRAAIILGLDVAWGSKNDIVIANPPPGLPATPTIGESFSSVTGAIGFRFSF